MKIAELIEQYSNLTKKEAQEVKQPSPLTSLFLPSHTKPFHTTRDIKKAPGAPPVPVIKKSSEEKVAFVPNPQVAQQMQQPQQPQQPQPQQGQQAPPQMPPSAAMPQPQMQAPPQQEQAVQQPSPQMPQDSNQTLMDEVMGAAQQLPPEIQQQIQPLLQQLLSMPPEQREQQLGMILQQMMSQGNPAGMEAQAGMEEDLLMAAQQQAQPQQMMQPAAPMPQEQPHAEDAASAEASAVEAKNELDNVRVNLSVRELLDLIGKGSATASLLKVKQLADQHNQKMEAIKQKAENEKQQKVQEEQAAQSPENMMGSGGIYAQPMTGAVN